MKTLAVIQNPLFKDYLRIVSTDDLEATLDDPNIPTPYTCVESVNNNNAELIAKELHSYFQSDKVKNKEFFVFDDDKNAQLSFMLNLVKLSSGHNVNQHNIENEIKDIPVSIHIPIPVEQKSSTTNFSHNNIADNIADNIVDNIVEKREEPIIPYDEPMFKATKEDSVETHATNNKNVDEFISELSQSEQEQLHIKSEQLASEMLNYKNEENSDNDDFDPFKFVEKTVEKIEEPQLESSLKTEPIQSTNPVEMIAEFGIPKNATLHFSRDDKVTATLVDAQNILFNGQTLSLNDSAKAALKQSGLSGLVSGLNNWLYNGYTLKSLKEQNA